MFNRVTAVPERSIGAINDERAAALKVLTLSSLYPSHVQPTFGIFVERQTKRLAACSDVRVEVVSPVGIPIWPLYYHPHYRARAELPFQESWNGLIVHRPRFRVWPKISEAGAAEAMASALLPILQNIHRRFAFDVIDAEFFWPDGPAAMHLARALQVPYLVKARGADIHYWGRRPGISEQIIEAGQAASKLLAVSKAMKDDMIAIGMPGEKISVHYTGVDLDAFRPLDRISAKQEIGASGPLLITIGALIPRKAQRLTIEATALISGATLLIVGEGPDRIELEKFARDLHISERVRFLGRQSEREVARLAAAADVMILPSTSEGLANAWVEALACGTPIVTSDAGGARELLRNDLVGRVVPREAARIAEAVKSLLQSPVDPELAREAASHFSWQRNSIELRKHLAATLAVGAER